MFLVVNRERFKTAFAVACSAVTANSPNEILQNVKVVVDSDDSAVVMGTNHSTGVRVTIPLIDSQPCQMLLNAKRVGSIINESNDDEIRFELDGNSIVLSGASFRFKLPTANPQEYPTVTEPQGKDCYQVPTALFAAMLKRTVYACDPATERYALGGILFEFTEDKKLIAVATDGRRISTMTGDMEVSGEPYKPNVNTVVPQDSIRAVQRFIEGSEKVSIGVTPSAFMVWHDGGSYFSRLLEGRYPNWRNVVNIRGADPIEIKIHAGVLFAAVRQASIVSDEETRGLIFDFRDRKLEIKSSTKDKGDGVVTIPIANEQIALATRLDFRYVRDFVSAIDPAMEVTLQIKDGDTAVKLITGDGYEGVIMPMALEQK